MKTTNPQHITDFITKNFPRTNIYTLVCVLSNDGGTYEVGIADKHQQGYTATDIQVETQRYDDACNIVDQANEILFPDRSKIDNAKIQLTTMRYSEA